MGMLVVQTAEELLYVPAPEVATMMPAYPQRWRVVLADGRVGHRTGEIPTGPWVRLGPGWANPEHLRRQDEFWLDPADYAYAHEPLEARVEESDDEELPAGLLTVEKRGKQWFWRTDSQELPCELTVHQLRELYPDLAPVNQKCLVYLPRVRRLGSNAKHGWLELDQGERLIVPYSTYYKTAACMGLESLSSQDISVQWKLWRLRELPYDLTNADPERIRRDLPNAEVFAEHLVWQALLQFERGQANDYGRDTESFWLHPLQSAGQRLGYTYSHKEFGDLLSVLIFHFSIFTYRQLGFAESNPEQRMLGKTRPQVVLLAPLDQQKAARKAAQQAGISLLLTGTGEQLALEFLAVDLPTSIQLLACEVKPKDVKRLRERFSLLGREAETAPVFLSSLSELKATVASLPDANSGPQGRPFRRIALQDYDGLVFVEHAEIVSWNPSRPSRYRVELQDGRTYHHPDPAPPELHSPPPPRVGGPDLPCPPQRYLWLEDRDGLGVWHLDDGSESASGLPFEEAADQHPGLSRISKEAYICHDRIRSTYYRERLRVRLDGGQEFPIPRGFCEEKLKQKLGLSSLYAFHPDDQGLRYLELRDVPYEIVRASAERLRADFSGPIQLMANIIWQVYCGLYSYGQGFSGFFYMPLQAVLYRAGYLGGPQSKDCLYRQFCKTLTRMVFEHKLFTYREIGFLDESPEDRILGDRQPQRILLVEKGDHLQEYALRLQKEFGITVILLKGCPSLLACEYFVADLREIYGGDVEVYFYGDFDHAGWDILPAFVKHLRFYGTNCTRMERLVLASTFSAEEQDLYARPLEPITPQGVGQVKRFVRESGGVQGQARGIHANWLQPFERVRARYLEVTSP